MSVKYGVCSWIVDFTNEPSCCETLSKMGFDGLQLDIGSYEDNFPLQNPKLQAEWKEEAQKHGLTLCSIMVNEVMRNGITSHKDSAEYKIAEKAIITALDVAVQMGISRVIIPSFRESGIHSEQDFNRTVEALRMAYEEGKKRNIHIVSENVLSVEESKRLQAEITKNCEKYPLKLHIDLFNYAFWKSIPLHEILPELLPLTCDEVHIKNGTSEDPGSLLLSAPGIAQLSESMQCLNSHNYNGWIFIENFYERPVFEKNDYTIKELMQNDLNWMKKSLNEQVA